MQDFIISFTEFIIGLLGWFVATVTGRFILVISLVIVAVVFCFKYLGK